MCALWRGMHDEEHTPISLSGVVVRRGLMFVQFFVDMTVVEASIGCLRWSE